MGKEVTEDKFIKIAEDAKSEEFKVLGDRVQRGELKWNHYAVDGSKSYHHYLILR